MFFYSDYSQWLFLNYTSAKHKFYSFYCDTIPFYINRNKRSRNKIFYHLNYRTFSHLNDATYFLCHITKINRLCSK